jgi:hypothetical protein
MSNSHLHVKVLRGFYARVIQGIIIVVRNDVASLSNDRVMCLSNMLLTIPAI